LSAKTIQIQNNMSVFEYLQWFWRAVLPYLGFAGMLASAALQISGYTNPKLAKILFFVSALILAIPLVTAPPWRRVGHYAIEHRTVAIILVTIVGALLSAAGAVVFLPSKQVGTAQTPIAESPPPKLEVATPAPSTTATAPPPSVTQSQSEKESEKTRAAREVAERWRLTSTLPYEEEMREQIRQGYQTICDKIAAKFPEYGPKKTWAEHEVRQVVTSVWFEPGLGFSEAPGLPKNSIWSGVRIEVRFKATASISFDYRSIILLGKSPNGAEVVALTSDVEKKNEVSWTVLSEGGSASANEALIVSAINQELDRLTDKITQDIKALQ
jgi:hypothetical protein